MANVRPFCGLRPPKELAAKIASPPYDVINSEEAREMASGNPYAFLHISKPEIDLDPAIDIYDDRVYARAAENLKKFIDLGYFAQDQQPYYYLYEQTMGDIIQIGLVAAASIDEYEKDLIKKHELTRADKEKDRSRHVDILDANTGPVFLTYLAKPEIDAIINNWRKKEPVYDFVAPDKIHHRFWVVDDPVLINKIAVEFNKIDVLYVADGHHRSAAACNVRKIRKDNNSKHTGDEEYNFFLSVIFPHNQLHVFDYNRIVKDLHGLTSADFIQRIQDKFEVSAYDGNDPYRPEAKHYFGMYLDKKWFKLQAKAKSYDDADPIESLDVSILQRNLLAPILGIGDPRTDKRIDFVGGIRGLKELEKRVDNDNFKVAFSMFPTSIEDLIKVADAGKIMPPKSTWFEPKLRSGLVLHLLK